jgi:hypothetical protein
MTGQEILRLKEARVFRQTVMDTIINEFTPATDQFLLTDAFLPFKLVNKDEIIDLVMHGAFGKTNPVNLGSDHRKIGVPGWAYKEHRPGYWREAVMYNEEVLQKAVKPERPTERWGTDLATSALNFLDQRLDNLIEYLTSKIIIDGQFSEARYGVDYTYNPNIPAKYYVDVASSPPWTSGGVWSNATNATPLTDIMQAMILMRRYGLEPEAAYMNVNTMEEFFLSDQASALYKQSRLLVEQTAVRKVIWDTLTGLESIQDNRLYAEETTFTAASAASDTTLEVEDASEFSDNDIITLRNAALQEEQATISSISNNILTVGAITNAYAIGDRVTVYKNFMPNDYVVIKARTNDRGTPNNWISTPSLIKGRSWTNPQPGRYTWTDFSTKVPYTLEIGAGIDGGPKVSRCAWFRIKV